MNNYVKSMPYEIFIRRAYKCERTTKNGADISFMTNLIDAENGLKQYKLGTKERQFETVRNYLIKACQKFLTKKLDDEERNIIENCSTNIKNAFSSNTLLIEIDILLSVTQRFK